MAFCLYFMVTVGEKPSLLADPTSCTLVLLQHFIYSQFSTLVTQTTVRLIESFSTINFTISLIIGWTVYTEKYKARGPDV